MKIFEQMKDKRRRQPLSLCLIAVLLSFAALTSCTRSASDKLYLLVGTYTWQDSRGIYVYSFNESSGSAEYISVADAENPSYLAVSSDEKNVYAVSESEAGAAACSFTFDKASGKLTLQNRQPAQGKGPCYISVDPERRFVATANYSSGSVELFPIASDGALEPSAKLFQFDGAGPDTIRQKHAHLHFIDFTPDGRFMTANDLGSDCIYPFAVSETAPFLHLEQAIKVQPAGTGPRHLAFTPDGRYAYLLGELSGEALAFSYDNGHLHAFQRIAADTTAGAGGKGSADIHVSPDGRFLYASNRLKADGIAIFRINENDGTLVKVGYQRTGIHPRNFIISPNGKFLLVANRDSNNIQIFKIDTNTGLLTDTKNVVKVSQPVCLKFIHVN